MKTLGYLEKEYEKKKIAGLFFCMLVFVGILPTISANQIDVQHFNSCYIVADGVLTEKDFPSIFGTSMWKMCFFRPHNDDRATILYWFIRFNEISSVTIYSEQNGEVLWQHQGGTVSQLRMIAFRGVYLNDVAENGGLHIELWGNISFIQVNEK